ncbi:unnamed protein product, partial [Adineta ricciae]
MNHSSYSSSSVALVELSDTEHTLILLSRSMDLNEIFYMMMLNNIFPMELKNKYDHIKNIINLHYHKSYEVHDIRSIIEFISITPTYARMFRLQSLDEMIQNYQNQRVAESDDVCELYLKPYTNDCIECKKELKLVFSHRPKTVLSLTRNYKA